jgi:hypothetical protein
MFDTAFINAPNDDRYWPFDTFLLGAALCGTVNNLSAATQEGRELTSRDSRVLRRTAHC